jgi:membrane AbrB-like protein
MADYGMERSPSSAGPNRRLGPAWALLFALTLAGLVIFELLHLPAAPMLAGIIASSVLSLRDTGLQISRPLFLLGQSLVGLMISQAFNPDVMRGLLDNWLLALMVVIAVILFGLIAGWTITIHQWLPGTTGIWGTSPGAATAMTLMSEAYGGDMRLVAIMQYLRVVIVSLAAAVVARFLGAAAAAAAAPSYWATLFPPMDWPGFALTIGVTILCCRLACLVRSSAAPILIPMFVGAILHNTNLMVIVLPGWLLAFGFILIGWSIGLRFNRTVFLYAFRAMPKILGAIGFMVASAGLLAVILVFGWRIDPLTAYLATSPGGVDAVAIIAASSGADMVFILAVQTVRLFLVLLTGPPLARLATRMVRKRLDNKK